MKKLALFLATILLLTLVACNKPDEGSISYDINSVVSAKIAESSESSASNSADNSESKASKIKELENEVKELEDEIEKLVEEIAKLNKSLGDAKIEKTELENQIKDLEEKIRHLKMYYTSTVKLKDDAILTIINTPTLYKYTVSVEYPDDTVVDIVKDKYLWTIKASPDGTKVIYNDYEWEYNAHVYLYDVEKRQTKELLMPNLPEQTTVEDMEWLDDRYFLFIVQFDAGTIVRGGNVYIYDTNTGKYQAIVLNSDRKFQSSGFNVYNKDFVVIHSYLYEETFNFTEDKYHLLTHDEIYDLIKNNKTVDLSKRKETVK